MLTGEALWVPCPRKPPAPSSAHGASPPLGLSEATARPAFEPGFPNSDQWLFVELSRTELTHQQASGRHHPCMASPHLSLLLRSVVWGPSEPTGICRCRQTARPGLRAPPPLPVLIVPGTCAHLSEGQGGPGPWALTGHTLGRGEGWPHRSPEERPQGPASASHAVASGPC